MCGVWPMQAAPSGSFDWGKQWYPMAIAADLDPGRPHAVELLGQPLVGASAAATSAYLGSMTPNAPLTCCEGHQQVINSRCRATPEDASVTVMHQVQLCIFALRPVGPLERRGGRVAGVRGSLPAPPRTPLRSIMMFRLRCAWLQVSASYSPGLDPDSQ
jgi:hypothetical protein